MSTLDAVRNRLLEIATTATTAAEALEGGHVDFLKPEVGRILGHLDAVAGRLAEVCDRLAVGVDPQGAGRRG